LLHISLRPHSTELSYGEIIFHLAPLSIAAGLLGLLAGAVLHWLLASRRAARNL
jgi:thiosulfate reductase cytochrome b subunit